MAGVPQFIGKLFKLAHAPTSQSYITWNEDGTQFWVTNIENFSRDVLPVYFKHNNYASFVRQLNMYGESLWPRNLD
jgi:heat shock transcription factor